MRSKIHRKIKQGVKAGRALSRALQAWGQRTNSENMLQLEEHAAVN